MVRKKKSNKNTETKTLNYETELAKKQEDNTLTREERELLRKLRQLKNMELDGDAREFWIRMDEARINVEQAKYFIKLRLQKIREINLEIQSNLDQVKSGKIWKHRDGYDDVKFTKEQLESEIRNFKLGIEKELSGIRSNIVQIIPFVAALGLDKQQILTKEQFNNYFLWVRMEVKSITGTEL